MEKHYTFKLEELGFTLGRRLTILVFDHFDSIGKITVIPWVKHVDQQTKIGGEVLTGGLIKSAIGFCPSKFIAVFNKNKNGGSIRFIE